MPGRFVIYGAGAVGGVIGGGLALGGHDVALIARGPHLKALQDRGLDFRHVGGNDLIPITAVEHPEELQLTPEDIVIMAMKTQHCEAALDRLAAAAPADVAIVCAQNGVENERLALRRFANVYGMCVMLPGSHLEPGVVVGSGAPVFGVLDVGRVPTGSDAVAERLATALTASNFRSQADANVMRLKYGKLRLNTGNALNAACGRIPETKELGAQAAAEAVAVYTAAGIDVATRDEESARRDGFKITQVPGEERSGSSSWQSLARGSGSIEADFLNGEIVLLGRQHGIPTPVNEALRQLANRMARNHEAPGTVTVDEVEKLVLQASESAATDQQR